MTPPFRILLSFVAIWSAMDLIRYGRPIDSDELHAILLIALGAAIRPYFG